MDRKLIWTESALEDLGSIVRHVAFKDGPKIAKEIGFGIYQRVQVLKQFPEAGSILPAKKDPRWRKLVFQSWKIAYKVDVDAGAVYLARIWHASREEIEIECPLS